MGNKPSRTTIARFNKENGNGNGIVKTKDGPGGIAVTARRRLSFLWLGTRLMSKTKEVKTPPIMTSTTEMTAPLKTDAKSAQPTSASQTSPPMTTTTSSALVDQVAVGSQDVVVTSTDYQRLTFSRTSSKRNRLLHTSSGRLKDTDGVHSEDGKKHGDIEITKEQQVAVLGQSSPESTIAKPAKHEKTPEKSGKLIEEEVKETCATLTQINQQGDARDDSALLAACEKLRILLSIKSKPPIQCVLDTGVVPDLITILKTHADPKILLEMCWAVTNIASGSTKQAQALVRHGVLDALERIIKDIDDEDCVKQVIWCLGNIAGDVSSLRNQCLNKFPAETIIEVSTKYLSLSMQQTCIWLMANLCRGQPSPNLNRITPFLPVFASVVSLHETGPDNDILADALWGISNVTDGSNGRIQRVVDTGCLKHLMEILSRFETLPKEVITPALSAVGNILTGDESHTSKILEYHGVDILYQMIKTSFAKGERKRLKELCWTLSNIAAGNSTHIEQLLQHDGLLDILRQIVEAGLEIRPPIVGDVKSAIKVDSVTFKEAVYVLSNMMDGCSTEQIELIGSGNPKYAILPYLICAIKRTSTAEIAKEGIFLCYQRLGKAQAIQACYRSKVSDVLLKQGSIVVERVCQYMSDGLSSDEKVMNFESTTLSCLLAMGFPCLDANTLPTLVEATKPNCSAFTFEHRICFISTMLTFAAFSAVPRLKSRNSHSWGAGRHIPIEIWIELKNYLFASDPVIEPEDEEEFEEEDASEEDSDDGEEALEDSGEENSGEEDEASSEDEDENSGEEDEALSEDEDENSGEEDEDENSEEVEALSEDEENESENEEENSEEDTSNV